MATNNPNNMPSFAQGSYANILKLIADQKVNAPAFIYFTDRECLGFLDSKKKLHVILWDKVVDIQKQLEGMNDPETGEPIKVTEYVQENITPIQNDITEIKQNGATIMITSDGGDD